METVLDAALSYVERGWGVIALSPNEKIPVADKLLQPNGSKSFTTDPEHVRKLWATYPKANVGIVTGDVSQITVIDFDSKEAYDEVFSKIGAAPTTLRVKTPRGIHLYLAYTPELKQTAAMCGINGLDIRQEGGYIVAPPSRVKDKTYTWVNESTELGTWDKLVELQDSYKPVQQPRTGVTALSGVGDQPTWVSEYLSNGAPEGQRNDVATRLAGYLNSKRISEDIARGLLESFRLACNPPMDERELDAVVRSIYSRYVPSEGIYTAEDLSAPIVDLSIANRRVFRWVEEDLVVDVSRIADKGSSLDCVLVFKTHTSHLYGPTRLNLLSSSSRESLVRQLKHRKAKNWPMCLDQIAQLISQSIIDQGAGLDMRSYTPENVDNGWCVRPFVQRNSPTLIYGMGGEGKSTVALAILLSKATGERFLPDIDPGVPAGVMYCDWEDTPESFYATANALLDGKGMTWQDVVEPVIYKRFHGALSDHVDSIQRDIVANNIELLCIDSLIAASDEDTNDAVAARTWHQIMSSLNVASIGITHVSKGGSDPYGSVYFWNLARSVWQVEKETEDQANTIIALQQRKSNNTGLTEPFGLHVGFEVDENTKPKSIQYALADLSTTENLVKKLTTAQHIISVLEGTQMYGEDVVKELKDLGIKEGTIVKNLQRMKQRGTIEQLPSGMYRVSKDTE